MPCTSPSSQSSCEKDRGLQKNVRAMLDQTKNISNQHCLHTVPINTRLASSAWQTPLSAVNIFGWLMHISLYVHWAPLCVVATWLTDPGLHRWLLHTDAGARLGRLVRHGWSDVFAVGRTRLKWYTCIPSHTHSVCEVCATEIYWRQVFNNCSSWAVRHPCNS